LEYLEAMSFVENAEAKIYIRSIINNKEAAKVARGVMEDKKAVVDGKIAVVNLHYDLSTRQYKLHTQYSVDDMKEFSMLDQSCLFRF
jgi:hypothetical protein